MSKKQLLTLIWIYVLSVLLILVCSVSFVLSVRKKKIPEAPSETEYIYVYWDKTEETDPLTPTEGWIVKEYAERVAIFTADGTLLRMLDTYTKTLPEADRRLLREGIPIRTESELYAIMEDYTE